MSLLQTSLRGENLSSLSGYESDCDARNGYKTLSLTYIDSRLTSILIHGANPN